MSHRIDEGGVIFGSIAIGGHQNAERLRVNHSSANWRRGNLMMHIGI